MSNLFNKVTYYKNSFILVVFLFLVSHTFSQEIGNSHIKVNLNTDNTDTLVRKDSLYNLKNRDLSQNDMCKFKINQLIIPVSLICIGSLGVHNDWLETQNNHIKRDFRKDIDRKVSIDDFSQYAPMVAVYGLNLAGVKCYHDFEDRTIILATSYLMMGITVNSLKRMVKEERPDGSDNQSFPSGHTATAFMGAQLLYEEYKDTSPWIGVAGYAVAAGTGFFRMYNNKHWFTDILAGAGIGMLSAKAAYWLYPTIKNKIFKGKHTKNIMAFPYYDTKSAGICCTIKL